jgi:hypothetical protein
MLQGGGTSVWVAKRGQMHCAAFGVFATLYMQHLDKFNL